MTAPISSNPTSSNFLTKTVNAATCLVRSDASTEEKYAFGVAAIATAVLWGSFVRNRAEKGTGPLFRLGFISLA